MLHEMREPQRSEFAALIRQGAGTLDIHDGQKGKFAEEIAASERLVAREIDRVRVHLNSLCPLTEPLVGRVGNILDVGCGTGATTVALALSEKLGADSVTGVDPNAFSIRAAVVRAAGYERVAGRVSFNVVSPGAPLPYEDSRFDLTVCVSVVEYMRTPEYRATFIADLVRVTKPGKYVLLITPNPFRLIDYHSHRLLGDWRRTEGYPWASPPWQLRRMFAGCDVRFLRAEQIARGLESRSLPGSRIAPLLSPLALFLNWQKILARKRV